MAIGAQMTTFFERLGDSLLEKGLHAESRRARLRAASAQLSFGRVEYLLSENRAGDVSEAILMLHGAVSDKNAWVRLARHLRDVFPLVIPDLPGHGNSTADFALDYGINAQALRIKELIEVLGIKRVHLFGNSMGGAIALRIAARWPELVSSLVLIDTAGVEATPSWLRQRIEQTGINPMIELGNAADYRAMLRIGMERVPYLPGIVVSALARAFVKRKAINQKIATDIERDLDQTAVLSCVAAPSLIVWGAADKVLHADNAAFLHQRLAGSRKIVFDKTGHVPMVEIPRQLASACRAFFAEIAPLS